MSIDKNKVNKIIKVLSQTKDVNEQLNILININCMVAYNLAQTKNPLSGNSNSQRERIISVLSDMYEKTIEVTNAQKAMFNSNWEK